MFSMQTLDERPGRVHDPMSLGRGPMASLMLQYDRPIDHTRNWNDYNDRLRDWISRVLQMPGAASFMAYRTADGASPNTITIVDFCTLADARQAARSDHLKAVLEEIRSTGVHYPKVLVVERSPCTPKPLRRQPAAAHCARELSAAVSFGWCEEVSIARDLDIAPTHPVKPVDPPSGSDQLTFAMLKANRNSRRNGCKVGVLDPGLSSLGPVREQVNRLSGGVGLLWCATERV